MADFVVTVQPGQSRTVPITLSRVDAAASLQLVGAPTWVQPAGTALTLAVPGSATTGQTFDFIVRVVSCDRVTDEATLQVLVVGQVTGGGGGTGGVVILDQNFDTNVEPFVSENADLDPVGGFAVLVARQGEYATALGRFNVTPSQRYRIEFTAVQGTAPAAPAIHAGTPSQWNRYGQSVRASPLDFVATEATLDVYMALDTNVAGHSGRYDSIKIFAIA